MHHTNQRISAVSSRTAEYYDNWASSNTETYDMSAVKLNFTAPRQLVEGSQISQGRVLDLGCGTGMLGKRLKERNPTILIDGIDCSLGMLRRAPAGVYRKLIHAQLEDAHLTLRDSDEFKEYDAIISCGVFGDYVHSSFFKIYLDFLKPTATVSIAGGLATAWNGIPNNLPKDISNILTDNGFSVRPIVIDRGYMGILGEVKYCFIHATRESK